MGKNEDLRSDVELHYLHLVVAGLAFVQVAQLVVVWLSPQPTVGVVLPTFARTTPCCCVVHFCQVHTFDRRVAHFFPVHTPGGWVV